MRTKREITLTFLIATALLCAVAALPCRAAETQDANLRPGDEPGMEHREFGSPERRTERIMNWLEKNDPEKAKQMQQLRNENPEKFRAEIHKIAREQFSKRAPERRKQMAEVRFAPSPNCPLAGPPGPVEPPREQFREAMRERLQERASEHLEWLKKNYPEEAQKLAEIKDKDPDLYKRQLMLSFKKYRRIMEASEENPELADVLKKDMELGKQQHQLLEKIKAASNEDEKKKLTGELEQVVGDRFDVIVKRKQAEYEQLLKRLETLKEDVNKSKTEIEKWKETKNERIKERINELISKSERFDWD